MPLGCRRARVPLLGVLGGAAALAAISGVAYCYATETQVSTYATYAEALADGADRRGWLPAFVPRSATELREVHDLDTNEQWLRFRAPVGDLRAMVAEMEVLSHSSIARDRSSPRRWAGPWPFELERRLTATPRSTELLSYHRTRGDRPGARCVAVEWREGLAYAWSC